MAYKRLIGIKRNMKIDPEFNVNYTEEIAKYWRSGYARQRSQEEIGKGANINLYLTHITVQNQHKSHKKQIVQQHRSVGFRWIPCRLKDQNIRKHCWTFYFDFDILFRYEQKPIREFWEGSKFWKSIGNSVEYVVRLIRVLSQHSLYSETSFGRYSPGNETWTSVHRNIGIQSPLEYMPTFCYLLKFW